MSKEEAVKYFDEFAKAFATYLRPYGEKLGHSFLDAGRQDLSMLLYFGDEFFVARMIGKWLGTRVKSRTTRKLDELLKCDFQGLLEHYADSWSVHFSMRLGVESSHVKASTIVPPLHVKRARAKLIWRVLNNAPSSFMIVDPNMIANQSRDQADNAGKKVIADRLSGQELRPSWLIQWTFVGLGPNILSGLDPDPKLAAYAPSELILESASVRPIDARIRFLKAATALKSAFDSLSSENENAIHAVIKEFPWILVREPEYTEFMSAPRLRYVEKIQVDDKNLISKTREVIPDFIYKLSDGSVLCVEIESYSKRLHTMQTETSFHVNSAQSNRAFFQIENYKSIIDVDGHSDICTQLGVPTVTTFRYLIVVGSRLQTGFDERSWEHQKRRKLQMGIEIQNWDYYLDLLYRTYEACGANRVTA